MSRETLAAQYVEQIGYDPFEDDPAITEAEVAQTLAEYAVEVARNGAILAVSPPCKAHAS